MKKSLFLLIMILLAAGSTATAGNETEIVANLEEGSSNYDMTYGQKVIGSTPYTTNRYTEDEVNALKALADTDSMLQSSANLASLQAAVGEATLGTETALPAFNFDPPPGPLAYMVSQSEYTNAVRTASTASFPSYNPAYGMGYYLSVWNSNFDGYIYPSLHPVTIFGIYLGSVVQPSDITSWTSINLDTGSYQPAQWEIDAYYDAYRQSVMLTQPDDDAMYRYYHDYRQPQIDTYTATHATDTALHP